MKYSAVIFDLDGTVLDTLEDLWSSVNYALRLHLMPERTIDEVRCFVGNGIGKLIIRSVSDGTGEDEIKSVLNDFLSYYMEHCDDTTHPYEGVPELLDRLSENGVKCSVLSNKADAAVKALCSLHFKGKFTSAVGEREGVRRKPQPDGVYAVLEELGVSKEKTVYVGDSEVDVETAKNAGLDMIAVDWGFRDRKTLADAGAPIIVSSVTELEKYL